MAPVTVLAHAICCSRPIFETRSAVACILSGSMMEMSNVLAENSERGAGVVDIVVWVESDIV